MCEAINWPEAMTPSRSPIHFTNELEVEASPESIWSLLVDPRTWRTFYPSDGWPGERKVPLSCNAGESARRCRSGGVLFTLSV